MKKILSLVLTALMFCVLLGNFSYVCAEEDFDEDEYFKQAEKEIKETITKEMVNEFKKSNVFKKVNETKAKRASCMKDNLDAVKKLAEKDSKYNKLENIIKNSLEQEHSVALKMIDEGLAIKDMDILHYYKGTVFFFDRNLEKAIEEFEKVKQENRPAYERFYTMLANSKNFMGNKKGALISITEGVNNAPDLNTYDVSSVINQELGNTDQYLKDRKMFLMLYAIDQMGY